MKKALITGGATGIGKATAILLQQNGYDVYITYNQTQPDYEVNAIKCNLENIDEIESAVESIGRVDLLVNNAGVSIIKMIREQSGAIINISSMWGQVGASCETLYSMTKAGIIGLTKALAKELAPSNITVNCIAPGIIDTRMNNMFDAEELKEEVPLGRLGTPDEIAKAVLFLAENPYITGQILGVNGGAII